VGDGLGGTGLQGADNCRLVRTARLPKGPLHRWVDANRDMALGNGLRPTEEAQEPIEQFVRRAIADRFLRDLPLFLEGDKEAVSPQLLSQGTQTRPVGRGRDTLCHGELLSRKGNKHSVFPSMHSIPVQEFAVLVFQSR
jgi:hypothetical protein